MHFALASHTEIKMSSEKKAVTSQLTNSVWSIILDFLGKVLNLQSELELELTCWEMACRV